MAQARSHTKTAIKNDAVPMQIESSDLQGLKGVGVCEGREGAEEEAPEYDEIVEPAPSHEEAGIPEHVDDEPEDEAEIPNAQPDLEDSSMDSEKEGGPATEKEAAEKRARGAFKAGPMGSNLCSARFDTCDVTLNLVAQDTRALTALPGKAPRDLVEQAEACLQGAREFGSIQG